MKQLHFEDYEELSSDIVDKFDSLANEYGDVAVVAKYDEAKEIVRELVCLGYSIEHAEFHRPSWDNYYDEYIILLNFDGIWCSQMKSNGEYTTDESEITYILDNCSSNVIPYCKSNIMYEVGVGDEEDYKAQGEFGCNYVVNGVPVNKEEFDNYVSKFRGTGNENSNYSIDFTGKISTDELEKVLMNVKDNFIENMFRMINTTRHPYSHLRPLEFFY